MKMPSKLWEREYGQFDFWVGEWDVSAGGQTAGTNTIQEIVNGCVLLENWTGASGGTGKSFNYYDPGKKKWIQIWIDSEGGVIQAEGGFANGAMSFVGKHIYRNGSEEHFRMTFTPLEDGSVRQFIEQSKDEGSTLVRLVRRDLQKKELIDRFTAAAVWVPRSPYRP